MVLPVHFIKRQYIEIAVKGMKMEILLVLVLNCKLRTLLLLKYCQKLDFDSIYFIIID